MSFNHVTYGISFKQQYHGAGGLEHLDCVSIQLGRIRPTDERIFFRGIGCASPVWYRKLVYFLSLFPTIG